MRISFGAHPAIERLAAVVGLAALGCAQDYRAEFPSWEPTSSLVPLVADRNVALRYIDESWALWRQYGKPDYTYVRAYQESAFRVTTRAPCLTPRA